MLKDFNFPKPVYWVYIGGLISLTGTIVVTTGNKAFAIVSAFGTLIVLYSNYLHQTRSSEKQTKILDNTESANAGISILTEHKERAVSPLPSEVTINIDLKLLLSPDELKRYFTKPQVADRGPFIINFNMHENESFDYRGDPFYDLEKFYIWIEFYNSEDLTEKIFSAKGEINIRESSEKRNPSVGFYYMTDQDFVRMSIDYLKLPTNNQGSLKYKSDLENSTLLISVHNVNWPIEIPPILFEIVTFYIVDVNETLNFALNDFETVVSKYADNNKFKKVITNDKLYREDLR